MRKNEFQKGLLPSQAAFFSAVALAVLPPKFKKKIKLYIETLPLIELLSYWKQCIASFSTIPFEITLLATSKASS